jgi:hypothetical protein
LENKWYPWYGWYTINFKNKNGENSFQQACFEAGLLKYEPLTQDEKIDESINHIKELANKLNRIPTVEEFENSNQFGYDRRALEAKLHLSYNNICKKYVSGYKLNKIKNYSEDELKNNLIQLKNKLGRVPLSQEIDKNGDISLSAYRYFYKKPYNRMIREDMKWEIVGHDFLQKTEEEMLDDYMNLFLKIKRIPLSSDIDKEKYMVTYSTYVYHFKSIYNICSLLNINLNLTLDVKATCIVVYW